MNSRGERGIDGQNPLVTARGDHSMGTFFLYFLPAYFDSEEYSDTV
jgi:hypothetical protein